MKLLLIIFLGCLSLFYKKNEKFDPDAKYHVLYDLNYKRLKSSDNKTFRQVSLLIADTLSVNMDSKMMEAEIQKSVGGNWGIQGRNSGLGYFAFKNKIRKKVLVLERFSNPPFIGLEEDLMSGDSWTITGESKTQLGYSTVKATTEMGGRIWEAWFTPEIPISDGPYKFSGLPGLIIELNSTDNEFNFKLNKFEKMPESQMVPQPKRYRFSLLPKDKYIEFVKTRFTRSIDELKSNGSTFGDDLEEERRFRAAVKKSEDDLNLIDIK